MQSCVLELQNVVGETVPETILKEKALKHRFDVEKALDEILNPSKWNSQSNTQTKVKISQPEKQFKFQGRQPGKFVNLLNCYFVPND